MSFPHQTGTPERTSHTTRKSHPRMFFAPFQPPTRAAASRKTSRPPAKLGSLTTTPAQLQREATLTEQTQSHVTHSAGLDRTGHCEMYQCGEEAPLRGGQATSRQRKTEADFAMLRTNHSLATMRALLSVQNSRSNTGLLRREDKGPVVSATTTSVKKHQPRTSSVQ